MVRDPPLQLETTVLHQEMLFILMLVMITLATQSLPIMEESHRMLEAAEALSLALILVRSQSSWITRESVEEQLDTNTTQQALPSLPQAMTLVRVRLPMQTRWATLLPLLEEPAVPWDLELKWRREIPLLYIE